MPGGFAEYFAAPARNLLKLPDEVPFDAGGLTSCAVITAVHAFRKAGLKANDTAVVLGAGGIGLLIIQLLVWAGVKTVAVSRSESSLKQATAAGAHLVVSLSAGDAPDRVREFAGGGKDGSDCVFELVGLAETMKTAAALVSRGGRIVVIGEEAEFPAIDTILIAQNELQIIGSRNGGMQDAKDALDFMAKGVIKPFIAKRFPLAEINEAMQFARSGKVSGRIIIDVR
jgi:D-arabinose 1-dehydrogenase-like Zn-dependent alcohol dehydrogenase